MYLGIDIGGSKTLIATLNDEGVIQKSQKFETSVDYDQFLKDLTENVADMTTDKVLACGVGVAGRINHDKGEVIAAGNLPWRNVPIKADIAKILNCPIVIENDAKMAALSEAMLLKDEYRCVLYMTVSTGIGVGVAYDQQLDPALQTMEGGWMILEHNGKMEAWEKFASGRAIKKHFGKMAKDITDPKDWQVIARNLAVGLIDLLAIVQPDVVVVGGSVGNFFDRLHKPLEVALKEYDTPLVPTPPLRQAQRPDQAVVYGCYDLAKQHYEKTAP